MKMYVHKTPFWLKGLYPTFTWHKSRKEKKLYLTFDDGPIPEVTAYVLEQLDLYKAKATFFCVGDNVTKNPEIFQQIIKKGHKVGNHTHNHLNGWKEQDEAYIRNVRKCEEAIKENAHTAIPYRLLRPPYGKIKRSQGKKLKEAYQIVMWDVLSGDFDPTLSPQDCLKKTIKYTKSGSIIIFHDSIKAKGNLQYALPLFLSHFTEKGFSFETL